MWYNGEDDPEIAAAIEEERASARSRRHSPKAKKGRALPARRAAGPGPPCRAAPAPRGGRAWRRGRGGRPANFCRVGGGGGRRDLPPPRRRLSRREGWREGRGGAARRNMEVVVSPGPAGKVGRGGVRGAGLFSTTGRYARRENVSVRSRAAPGGSAGLALSPGRPFAQQRAGLCQPSQNCELCGGVGGAGPARAERRRGGGFCHARGLFFTSVERWCK